MALALDVAGNDLLAALQVTDNTLLVTNRGYRSTGTLTFRAEAPKAELSITTEDEVVLHDGAALYYGGFVKTVTPVGCELGWRALDVECQDYTILAAWDAIDGDGHWSFDDNPTATDRDVIAWLFGWGTKGVTIGAEVGTLRLTMPSVDYTGKTLAEALDSICQLTGGSWYIDCYKALHYFVAESLLAPFGLSDAPNYVSTFGYDSFSLPQDSIGLVNAVYYIPGTGGDAVPTWYEDPVSIAAIAAASVAAGGTDDGRREASKKDERVTLQTTLDSYGAAFLLTHAKTRTGSLVCSEPGLFAGMSVPITNDDEGLSAVPFAITTVTTRFAGGVPVYGIAFGDRPINLQTAIGNVATQALDLQPQITAAIQNAIDVTPPSAPISLSLAASVVQTTAGPVTVLVASLVQPTESDTVGCWVELTDVAVAGQPDFSDPQRGFIGIPETSVAFPGVLPLTTYYARARAFDVADNLSAYTDWTWTLTPADDVAPDAPLMLVAIPGFRALGCAWYAVPARDLDHYELQYAPEDLASPGDPNTAMWSILPVGVTTVHQIPNLDPALLWFVQARAVDTSGNASAWTASVSGQPSLIGATDISAAKAVIDLILTGQLTADAITSGALTIQATGAISGLYIRDLAAPNKALGEWTTAGLIIRDPADRTRRFLLLTGGAIKLVVDGVVANAVTAMTPDGIDASMVNFGAAIGGANLVKNPSFERAPYLTQSLATVTTQAQWTAAETAADNRTLGDSITVAAW